MSATLVGCLLCEIDNANSFHSFKQTLHAYIQIKSIFLGRCMGGWGPINSVSYTEGCFSGFSETGLSTCLYQKTKSHNESYGRKEEKTDPPGLPLLPTSRQHTTITNCRQPHGTARKSHSTFTRHQEDKLSKAHQDDCNIRMDIK